MSSGGSWRDELRTTTVGGVSTRYWLTGQTGGTDGVPGGGTAWPQVLVLHGWGAQIETVHPIVTGLASVAEVLAVDLPGFGESEVPHETWGMSDYAGWVLELLDQFGWQRPSIVGHSFGGKTSILFAATHPERVNRLMLVDASGIKPHRGLDYYLKVYSAKFVKHTAAYLGPLGEWMRGRIAARAASTDYANAGALRPTFVRIVNEHMTSYLPRIKASTVVIWGDQDTAVPLSDGQLMESLIPDAALIVFEGAGHYAYLDEPGRFRAIAQSFLGVAVAPTEDGSVGATPAGRSESESLLRPSREVPE